jgi:hypothetical protein
MSERSMYPHVFGEKSGAANSYQASSNSPTVAVVRAIEPPASFGLGDHRRERGLRFALTTADRLRRVPLLAGHRIATEERPQLP